MVFGTKMGSKRVLMRTFVCSTNLVNDNLVSRTSRKNRWKYMVEGEGEGDVLTAGWSSWSIVAPTY
jgi:hypothetical protein